MSESWRYRRLDELGGKKRPVLKAGPFGSAVTKGSYVEAGYKVYGQQEVVSGDVNSERYYISPKAFQNLKSCDVEAGDILITMMGTVGRLLVVPEGAEPGIINPRLMRISLDKSTAEPAFVSAFLGSAQIQRLLERRAHGGTMLGLNTDALGSLKIPLPPLPEQRKIAEILRTWDEAIEKLEALRAAKRDRLTGLTQKLLGLGGAFPDRWKLRPLSVISTRVRRQNGGGDHPVMTISAKYGFRLQSDKFSRDMAGSSVDRYIVLQEGEFAYNKGNSLTAPYGCIFPLDRPTALVPFVYFCFAFNAGMNREFFAHLFASGALNHQLSRLINSGVRNDGLLNLNPEDFFGCKVPVPPVEEQSAIASALTAAKQEIGLLETEIETLTRQKRGLMQKLLTGEWRVTVDAAPLSNPAEETANAG